MIGRKIVTAGTPCMLRPDLDRWAWQVKELIDAPKGAGDEQVAAISPNHPVFEIVNPDPQT